MDNLETNQDKKNHKPIFVYDEMSSSYLSYAMSVIVSRALPDVRDGLKPVHRRIIYAMYKGGFDWTRQFRKSARIVGDVIGKYHPHGDQAVYDALVRMVQDCSMSLPLIDGQGNFGSIDGDPPAAMRYTETKLSKVSQFLTEGLEKNTVDFRNNYDETEKEPGVLPSQYPNLLVNGAGGIAVGMATSIPPHNLGEIIDATVAYINNRNITISQLMKKVPGPDFPTGGEILISNGIRETYTKGRGSITMRGIAHIEEINPGKGKHKKKGIVITELPYQVNKASWIEKLADLVNNSKIEGIADIRDESDRDGMRIVVELRRDTDIEKVKTDLQRKTSLQNNFSAILLALVNGQPKQLSLKELLKTFLEYREETVIRMRYGIGKPTNYSIEDIGAQFCLTRERIRQIEIKALRKLRANTNNAELQLFFGD